MISDIADSVSRHLTTYSGFMGELKGLGELGLSVYGEKADIKPVLGEGIIGDFNAMVASAYK